jgi:cholesterol oxidase
MEKAAGFDYDWIVIGSGFGGSVSALRLAEKGYTVAVLERGRRFRDDELPTSAWQMRRYFWSPRLGCKGLWNVTFFKDLTVLSGASVGGGSNNYAATLYRAPRAYFQHLQWRDLDDWETRLAPHYDTAERMLGASPLPFAGPTDGLMKELAQHLGCADTFRSPKVGVYFGAPGRKVADPYFGGEGPERTGCTRCGSCMLGCPIGAKNTLPRNYLWLAEKRGAQILPERTVTDVAPLGAADGADGYVVTTQRTGAWFAKDTRRLRAKGVVFAAGALGTNELLAACKRRGSLPELSPMLGKLVRTNSETILAVTLPDDRLKAWNTVSITGSIFPDADTHIEFATFGPDADAMALLFSLMTGPGTRLTRPLKAFAAILRHPLWFLKKLWPFGWSRRSIAVGCMQTLDNAISFRAVPRLLGDGVRLQTQPDPQRRLPTYFPVAQKAAEWLAHKLGGIPQSFLPEALLNRPTTAHILGGAVIGADAQRGVVNARQEVFGYRNLLVCDGSVIPANPGVNPSLTITAMAECAIGRVPDRVPT